MRGSACAYATYGCSCDATNDAQRDGQRQRGGRADGGSHDRLPSPGGGYTGVPRGAAQAAAIAACAEAGRLASAAVARGAGPNASSAAALGASAVRANGGRGGGGGAALRRPFTGNVPPGAPPSLGGDGGDPGNAAGGLAAAAAAATAVAPATAPATAGGGSSTPTSTSTSSRPRPVHLPSTSSSASDLPADDDEFRHRSTDWSGSADAQAACGSGMPPVQPRNPPRRCTPSRRWRWSGRTRQRPGSRHDAVRHSGSILAGRRGYIIAGRRSTTQMSFPGFFTMQSVASGMAVAGPSITSVPIAKDDGTTASAAQAADALAPPVATHWDCVGACGADAHEAFGHPRRTQGRFVAARPHPRRQRLWLGRVVRTVEYKTDRGGAAGLAAYLFGAGGIDLYAQILAVLEAAQGTFNRRVRRATAAE